MSQNLTGKLRDGSIGVTFWEPDEDVMYNKILHRLYELEHDDTKVTHQIRKYDKELELSYQVPTSCIITALVCDTIIIQEQCQIQQVWLGETKSIAIADDKTCKIKSRVRKTIKGGKSSMEYTTKFYYFQNDQEYDRIELNTPITDDEYKTIIKTYGHNIVEAKKTRTTVKDANSGLIYFIDVYPHDTTVKVDIEFKTTKERDEFVAPEWLQSK